MTDDRLAEIAARLEAGKPGINYTTAKYSTGEKCTSCDGTGRGLGLICGDCGGTGLVWQVAEESTDVADLRYLLNLVASLTAERDALRAVVEEVRALHRVETIPVLQARCWQETGVCEHDDGDGCEAAATPTEVCRHCTGVWDDDRDREEPLPDDVKWPCATVKVLGRGLKGSGE